MASLNNQRLERKMKLFRVIAFVFFAAALYGSVDCLLDSNRITEHNGAWISVYICVIACVLSTINPYE